MSLIRKNSWFLSRLCLTFNAKLYSGSDLQSQSKSFYDIIVDCLNRLERETNQFIVTISSAHPLTDEQKERLLPLIEKKMSLKVRSIKEQIDEGLIGGFVIFANHKTIDVSIKQQLRVVKENLK